MNIEEIVEKAKEMDYDEMRVFTLVSGENPHEAIGRICYLLANEDGSFRVETASFGSSTIHVFREFTN